MFIKVRTKSRQVGYLGYVAAEEVSHGPAKSPRDFAYTLHTTRALHASGKDKGSPITGSVIKAGTSVIFELGRIEPRKNDVMVTPSQHLALSGHCSGFIIPPQNSCILNLRFDAKDDIDLNHVSYLFGLYAIE